MRSLLIPACLVGAVVIAGNMSLLSIAAPGIRFALFNVGAFSVILARLALFALFLLPREIERVKEKTVRATAAGLRDAIRNIEN